MYNTHRGMVPAPNSRLTELLDQLRQEFENQTRSTGEFEHQRTCVSFLLLPVHVQFARDPLHGEAGDTRWQNCMVPVKGVSPAVR